MHDPLTQVVHFLFMLNVGLQLLDGIVTYQGLQAGVQEVNPILRASMARWGIVGALLGWKLVACGLLVFLRMVNQRALAVKALTLTAMAYVCFSLVPWLWFFFSPGVKD
jgi:hypothetical protein